MLSMFITGLALPKDTLKALSLTYWAELIALCAFGFAWIVAGKYFSPLVDDDEALRLLS